jgi:hypothetical protein
VGLEPNTRDGYARLWERHLRPRVGGYRLRDVSPAMVDRMKAELAASGVGAPTTRKALALLYRRVRLRSDVGSRRPESGAGG